MNIKSIATFIKSSLKEISPLDNLKVLNTNIRSDILSGITVAVIALPLALAFGEISQLGPIAGIWGAIAGGIVGGLFGGCMVGVSGPTAPKAAQLAVFYSIIAGGTSGMDPRVAAFSIIFLSGLILIAISLMKVSRFIHYTPYPVVAGFMCGIGVIVVLTQINAFVGLPNEKDIHSVLKNFKNIFQISRYDALFVSVPSLLILFSWPMLTKKISFLKNIPAPLVALSFGTIIAYVMNLNIPCIGDRMEEAGNVDIFSFEIIDFTNLSKLIGPAFALAGLAILDSLLSCKVADNMTGTHHSSDRETFGQGMANVAAGLLGGVTTATATMRTVANIKFGGKTPLASIVHGLTLLAILLGLGSLVAKIPTACLAAILFKVGIDILDYRVIPILRKVPYTDLIIFIIVLFVTVYEDLMVAVAIGVAFAFIFSFKELNAKYEYKLTPLSELDYLSSLNKDVLSFNKNAIVLQIDGPLFFASVENLMDIYVNSSIDSALIIDMEKITSMDLSGAFALDDIVKDAQSKSIDVYVINIANKVKEKLDRVNSLASLNKNHYL